MKIVFVHGRSQEDRSENSIKTEWVAALNNGLKSIKADAVKLTDVIVPYYGNTLFKLSKSTTDPNVKKRSSEAAFLAEVAVEVIEARVKGDEKIPTFRAGNPTGTEKRQKTKINSAETSHNETKRDVQNIKLVVDAVRFLDERFPKLSGWTISRVLRDVHVYLTDPEIGREIDDIVEAKFPNEPFLVVSHSLGTVVAYNILRKSSHQFKGLITLGSPLGIKAVRSRLKQPITRPSVTTWANLFDPQDIVALNPLNTENFSVFPDQLAIIDVKIKNSSSNHHNITPYLKHKDTAMAIGAALKEGRE